MSQVDEAVLDLTFGEASFLADVLGVAPPPGLTDSVADADDEIVVLDDLIDDLIDGGEGVGADGSVGRPMPAAAVSKVVEIVAPGLLERRLVDTEGTVAAPVADLLTVTGSPHLVARVCHESGGVMEERAFTARPEMAVEQRTLADGRVRFAPFDPADLVDRIMEFVVPGGRPDSGDIANAAAADISPFECSAASIDGLFADDVGRADAIEALISDGVSSQAAEALVEASAAIRSSGSVALLLRPVDGALHGISLHWMDAGDHGIWLTEPSPTAGRRVIERVAPSELAIRLAELLPVG